MESIWNQVNSNGCNALMYLHCHWEPGICTSNSSLQISMLEGARKAAQIQSSKLSSSYSTQVDSIGCTLGEFALGSEQLHHQPAPPWRPRPQAGRGRRPKKSENILKWVFTMWHRHKHLQDHPNGHEPKVRINPFSAQLFLFLFAHQTSGRKDGRGGVHAMSMPCPLLTIKVAMVLMQPTVPPPLACQWKIHWKATGIDLREHNLLQRHFSWTQSWTELDCSPGSQPSRQSVLQILQDRDHPILQDHDEHVVSLPLDFLLSWQLLSIRRGPCGKQQDSLSFKVFHCFQFF